MSAKDLALIDALLRYAGEARRAPNLFNEKSHRKSQQAGADLNQGGKRVHATPATAQSRAGQHREGQDEGQVPSGQPARDIPKAGDIIVFIVGGATFEEALKVKEFNAQYPQYKVILGGSCIHNSMTSSRRSPRTSRRLPR